MLHINSTCHPDLCVGNAIGRFRSRLPSPPVLIVTLQIGNVLLLLWLAELKSVLSFVFLFVETCGLH